MSLMLNDRNKKVVSPWKWNHLRGGGEHFQSLVEENENSYIFTDY